MARMTIGREVRFSAAHHLPHVPADHKCHRMHGHSYLVRVEVVGEVREPEGWVIDFGVLDEQLVEHVRSRLDHRLLNDTIPNPTAENLAQWCVRALAPHLAAHRLALVSVEVREGDGGGWARWQV